MPWIFYAIGAVLPATYFIELARAIVIRGATFAEKLNTSRSGKLRSPTQVPAGLDCAGT